MSGIHQAIAAFTSAAAGGGITFRSAGTVSTGASMSPGMPAGFAAGDLLVVVGATKTSGGGAWTLPPAAGYIASNVIGLIGLWYKIADGSETTPSITVTGAGNSDSACVILAYTGVNGTPLDVQNASIATGSSTTATTTSLTTTAADDLIISVWAAAITNSITADANTTSRVSNTAVRVFTVADEIQASAGASTARVGSLTNAAWQAFAISFKKA